MGRAAAAYLDSRPARRGRRWDVVIKRDSITAEDAFDELRLHLQIYGKYREGWFFLLPHCAFQSCTPVVQISSAPSVIDCAGDAPGDGRDDVFAPILGEARPEFVFRGFGCRKFYDDWSTPFTSFGLLAYQCSSASIRTSDPLVGLIFHCFEEGFVDFDLELHAPLELFAVHIARPAVSQAPNLAG